MVRTEYEMTEADLETLLSASKPVRYMVFGGMPPASPQENANRAWSRLGDKMGFDWNTVEPQPHRGDRCFTAVKVAPPSDREQDRTTPLTIRLPEPPSANQPLTEFAP